MRNLVHTFLITTIALTILVNSTGCGLINKIAPAPTPPKNAIILFDGTDFSHWKAEKAGDIKWTIEDGVMTVVPKSGSIVTKRDFRDFRLHLEFNLPERPPRYKGQARGNSGIYIQKRYEVQILDTYGLEPTFNGCGSLYRARTPDKNACKKPGTWQTYDIIFREPRWHDTERGPEKTENMRITVRLNGDLIHDNAEIANKTGMGRPEAPEPGPIKLQDHGNKVKFRNIWIVPLN